MDALLRPGNLGGVKPSPRAAAAAKAQRFPLIHSLACGAAGVTHAVNHGRKQLILLLTFRRKVTSGLTLRHVTSSRRKAGVRPQHLAAGLTSSPHKAFYQLAASPEGKG